MPAEAPRPGITERAEATEAAQMVVTIKYDGSEFKLAWNNLPMKERRECRIQSKRPLSFWLGDVENPEASVIDADSFCILMWLARRADGEPDLKLSVVDEEWDPKKFEGIEVETPDPGDIDPEA